MAFLTAALERVMMLADIDGACVAAGVWPHAVFSGHAHNYQRYTRTVHILQIKSLVARCGWTLPTISNACNLPDTV